MRSLRLFPSCLLATLFAACSSSAPEATTPAASAQASAGAEQAPVDLTGEWVEYWALAGTADTQRYHFAADGTFVWRTAVSTQDEPIERSGGYAVEGGELVLRVDREVMSDGSERALVAPEVERLPLAECPPNEEARALDASYRCESIGSRVFWLRVASAK